MPSNPAKYSDPRLRPDFDPAFAPRCDGEDLPPLGSLDRGDQRRIEFAAVYYELNRIQALLDRARGAKDRDAEVNALKTFIDASKARDELEDRCHPEGIYAEPVKEGSRYDNLWFQGLPAPRRPRVHVHQFTAEFSF